MWIIERLSDAPDEGGVLLGNMNLNADQPFWRMHARNVRTEVLDADDMCESQSVAFRK